MVSATDLLWYKTTKGCGISSLGKGGGARAIDSVGTTKTSGTGV
jgi:hypothetical protein